MDPELVREQEAEKQKREREIADEKERLKAKLKAQLKKQLPRSTEGGLDSKGVCAPYRWFGK